MSYISSRSEWLYIYIYRERERERERQKEIDVKYQIWYKEEIQGVRVSNTSAQC